jgi:hypothetical protein
MLPSPAISGNADDGEDPANAERNATIAFGINREHAIGVVLVEANPARRSADCGSHCRSLKKSRTADMTAFC